MRCRLFTPLLGLALLTGSDGLVAQRANQPSTRPNVVLVIMDDMGYGDLGSYGVQDAKTPNLDRLAREGVRLTDAYANGPVCSPTRAALISGRYQQRVGIEWALASTTDKDKSLPVSTTSLPALLKKNGYATALVGKWHLGFNPEIGPNAHGFDEFFGFLSGATDYYTHRNGDGTPDLYENTTPVETPAYLTDEISRRAAAFIDRHAAASTGPFFLEVAYNAVHWPFQPPDLPASDPRRTGAPRPHEAGDRRLIQMADDTPAATRADYVKILENADQGVGRILAALDRSGAAANTLVIFTNDNGGEWLSRNAPLYHRKGTLWEGGIRVPLILRWPGRLPANRTSDQVAITMDLNRSILAATGTELPAGYRPDGVDILPMIAGQSAVSDRVLFWRIVRTERQQKAVRSGRWKMLVDGGQYLLFDLRDDPGERLDVAAQHTDLIVKLKAQLAEWEKDVDRKTPSQ
ncbi:MAG TPA: sulfatase-like hydrolase/transferase [Vicinamibacterales bacterium]|jgi:arylsulfatase A-like enzyme